MPKLADALKPPANLSEMVQVVANATPPAAPAITPREQPGLAVGSMGPAPSVFTTEYDRVRQWFRPGTSQNRFPPLPSKANPAINASAESIAKQVTSESTSGITDVGLTMPSQFVVSNSPLSVPGGTLGVDWLAQFPGAVLQAPPPGLGAFQGFNFSAGSSFSGPSFTWNATMTPRSNNTFAIAARVSNGGNPGYPPAGWNLVAGQQAFVTQNFTSTAPISIGETQSGGGLNGGALVLFDGPPPTQVQSNHGGGVSSVNFTSANTAGNMILVVVVAQGRGTGFPDDWTISDTHGNTYVPLVNQTANGFVGAQASQERIKIWIANGIAAGAGNTVTIVGNIGNLGQTFVITEWTPLSAGAGTPIFTSLFSSEIPAINLAATGNGGVVGILPLNEGGTGANLSATGGTSQFVSQASVGAALTVIQPDFSDLAGAAAKFATHYNGIALVSNGLPSETAKSDLTAQGAAIAATTIYAVPASGQGMYRISWSADITTADAVSSTLGGTNGFQVLYTSPTDSVVKTTVPQADWTSTANTTGTAVGGSMVVFAKASTNIQYSFDYTSNTPGQMKYELHIKVEAL